MIGRVALPIVLATIIAVVVSFAVQGFISFVNLVSSYLRGDNHIFLGLPKEILLLSGPILAGILAIMFGAYVVGAVVLGTAVPITGLWIVLFFLSSNDELNLTNCSSTLEF